MKPRLGWAWGLVLFTCACGPAHAPVATEPLKQAPRAVTAPASAPPTPPESWSAMLGLPALVSARVATAYAQSASLLDPRQLFFGREQTPPSGFRPLPRWAKAFPGGKHAKVLAFHFANDRLYPGPATLDGTQRGCGGSLVARDGTFCPSVQYPGRALTDMQAEALFQVVNGKDDREVVVMNGYNFDQGFVVLDARDVPVAQVLVDADGMKILTTPRVSPHAVDDLAPPRRQQLRDLLREVGLWRAPDPVLTAELHRQAALDGALHDARFLPFSSGIDRSTRLDSVSTRERASLCGWQQQVWLRGAPRSGADGGSIECPDGWKLGGLGYDSCIALFPACDRAVGDVEDCMRAQRFDSCHDQPAHLHCRELRACFWGLDTRQGAAR